MASTPYVSRVNQVDAAQLDDEIYKVLKNQIKEIAKDEVPGKIDEWQAEINAVLKLLIWNFSMRRGKSTFGQQLLNLHYANITKTKSFLYMLLTILPEYALNKVSNNVSSYDDPARRYLKSVLEYATNAVKLLQFANLLIFLNRGTQPLIVESLLGISSRSITTHKPRSIGYSYMTRELLWHGLMELFTLGLPMINYHYLKQTAKRLFYRKNESNLRSSPRMTLDTRCAYCNDSPILPCHAGCEHIFCYYCLKAHFTAISEFPCPLCDVLLNVENMRNYQVV